VVFRRTLLLVYFVSPWLLITPPTVTATAYIQWKQNVDIEIQNSHIDDAISTIEELPTMRQYTSKEYKQI
jgi:hypothetical protein